MVKQLTERAWYLPWEEETDRPNLCYILGERHSLAVDAGNSPAHVRKFYRALEELAYFAALGILGGLHKRNFLWWELPGAFVKFSTKRENTVDGAAVLCYNDPRKG